MLIGLLALHVGVGAGVLSASRRVGRWGLVIGAIAPVATVAWVATRAGRILDGEAVAEDATWVAQLGLTLDVRLDAFGLLMVVLVSGIGSLVFAYGWHYFGRSPKTGRAAGLLTLFAGSMLGVVLADNLLMLYVCWELTSITSYLLIGIDDSDPKARAAALHALVVTAFGGLAMLGGFVLLGQAAGTYRISELLANPPTSTTSVSVALMLVLLGALTKSAQYPFHSWLPSAMVAPTPISAYLHSAAMVKAGVYLVARFAPAFADVGIWRPVVVTAGLVTMVAGGLRALRPFDLKQLLAFGTISQLGFMMVLFGIGRPEATAAGCALLLAHGLFKAALFMVVGIVDHETGTRDIHAMPLLGPAWTPLRAVAVLSAASMAAIPPLAGFIAKEEAYGALLDGGTGERMVLVGIVTGSILTVAYSLRFAAALLRPDLVSDEPTHRSIVERGPSAGFVLPAVVLAVGSMLLGVAPLLWTDLVDHAALALDAGSGTHLELWHGFTSALVLSAITVGAGAFAFVVRRRVAAGLALLAPRVNGTDVFDAIVRGVLRMAARVTAVAQSGSLPIYAAVIFATAAVVPAAGLLSGPWWPGWPEVIDRPAHIPIAMLLVVAALAACRMTRRFAAALMLGVAGYGMALLFIVHGAPDLALTQFAVETLSVVVFLLVLRRLPDRFERRAPAIGQVYRVAVSAAVGTFAVVMAIAASGARTAPPVSQAMSERALPDGDGSNIVNVIIVDIRGWDTVGEVSVLVAAGIGIVALTRAGERPRRPQLPGPRRARAEPRP